MGKNTARQTALAIDRNHARECPLRCPGCYAYDPAHLGGGVMLRQLNDRKGSALVDGVLELADRLKPLHVSIVGGDPLVRYRELEILVPQLLNRGIDLQSVTSAFRPLPAEWTEMPRLNTVVSIRWPGFRTRQAAGASHL